MEYRSLGASGLKVSCIAFGNWLTHGYSVEKSAAIECVHTAFELGVMAFGTADADANGRAESVLGEALKPLRRESVEICIKIYYPVKPFGANGAGLSRKHILESVNGSLRRLQTDYVDLYQAHRYGAVTPLEEAMLVFADVVQAGEALYIGVSEWSADQIRRAKHLATELDFPLVASQPQYSMLWRAIEAEVVATCKELGLGQLVWASLAAGVLTGKYVYGHAAPAGSRGTDRYGAADMNKQFLTEEVLTRVGMLRPIADELGLSMAQLAVAWVLQNDAVAAAIVGASTTAGTGERRGGRRGHTG